jgi:hypothetical protein
MRIDFDGKVWDFEQRNITIDEWREFKRKYRMTPAAFGDGMDEGDPDALTFLYWTMHRQNGRQNLTLGDHLKFDVIALNHALAAAVEAGQKAQREADEAEAGGEPDPTQPSAPPSSPAVSPPSTGTPAPAPTPNHREGAAQPTAF